MRIKNGRNVRVIVASEYPEVQYFLRGVVEQGGGAVTVGQAQDASAALALAKNLKPDVALIDCYLPYALGFDDIPLSRIGGLDTAEAISKEIPNMRVILLNNLDTAIMTDRTMDLDNSSIYSIVSRGASVPLLRRGLSDKVVQLSALVFAKVEAKPGPSLKREATSLYDKAIFFGGLSVAGGWLLIITIMLAPAGVFLALVGAVILFLGLLGKLTTILRRRFFWK